MGKIRSIIKQNPAKAEELLQRMKSGMDQLASKAIHSGVTEKYTSINTKNGYIEFRSPGGDWLDDNFAEIENTLRRFTVALSAAVDPEMYRKEYLKKLYKLLDVSGEKDPLSYFAKYSAGELPRAALKSFVRQAQAERKVKSGKADAEEYDKLAAIHQELGLEPPQRAAGASTTTSHPEGRGRPHDPTGRYAIVARSDQAAYGRTGGPAPNYQFRFNMQNLEDQGHGRYVLQAWAARNSVDPADYIVVDTTQYADAAQGGTVDVATDRPAPQPAGSEFTGNWLIRAEDGTVLHRFGGIGNSQADANRTAQTWAQRNPDVMRQHPGGVDVVPEILESLNESNQLRLKDFVVTISPHALSQAYNKGVDVNMVDDMLRNISKVKDNIMSLEPGRALILHNGRGTGLGVRRGQGNNLTLATVFPTSPGFRKGKHPTFQVGTDSGIDESVEEGSLSEIDRLPGNEYTGGKKSLRIGAGDKNIKKLPGTNTFMYSTEANRLEDGIIIKLWDSANTTPKPVKMRGEDGDEFAWRLRDWERNQSQELPGLLIGKLVLEDVPNFPLKGALQVDTITVDEDYRGQGVAKSMYGVALSILRRPLLAGSSQTPGGRRNWVSLASTPGVELKGYVMINKARFDNPEWAQKDIDIIMGKLGGQYIGPSRPPGIHYFAFDVVSGSGELAPAVKTELSKIYDNYQSGIGLYAVWSGAVNEQDVEENFHDGKNPGRKGLAKRSGVNTKASVSSLRKTAKNSSGEKQRMAHWLANMKAGRAKAKRK
jgi:GNAT superfamily N-acetyltransferase